MSESRGAASVTLDTTTFTLTLRWTCQTCGWSIVMDAPGFAGDGKFHYPDGQHPCGPITAQKDWSS